MEAKPTSKPSWRRRLRAIWKRLQKTDPSFRIAILGVGQELNGDDATGVLAARQLAARIPPTERLLIIEAGSAPENFTGMLERFQPGLVLLIDAVTLGETAGSLAWIDQGEISGYAGSTHSLPLTLFSEYVGKVCRCEIGLVGIQPASLAFGSPVSDRVMNAVNQVVGELHTLISKA